MIIISSREFRDNQKKYFDLVDSNGQIIIQHAKSKKYWLFPVHELETSMTEDEFVKKIEESIKQVKQGSLTSFKNVEDSKAILKLWVTRFYLPRMH